MVVEHLQALTDDELERYSSHFLMPDWTQASQLMLKNASVSVVGAGGLGVPVATMLACSGVGKVTIIDFDTVNHSNLARQFAYTSDEVGLYKSTCLAQKLQAQNPCIRVESVTEELTPDNCDALLENSDVVLDCSDQFKTRFLINDYCVRQKHPFIYGAVQQHQGMVALFDPKNTPGCLRCFMDEAQLQEQSTTCQEMGVLVTTTNLVASLMVHKLLYFLVSDERPDKPQINYVQLQLGTVRAMHLPVMPDCDCALIHKR